MIFDLRLALLCAYASDAAYMESAADRAAYLAPTGLTETAYIVGDRDARALVCEHALYGEILAFQGTQFTKGELESIAANLDTTRVPAAAGVMMEGYWRQAIALAPQLDTVKPKHVTGHSLGGATAHLYVNGTGAPLPDTLITFGAPKCADHVFWEAPRLLPIRFIREQDGAPNWPADDFDQPDNPFMWLHGGVVTDTIGRPFWPLNISVEDHASERYVSDLIALTQGTA